MGYSYQDIESRLRSVEDKLDFIMAAVRQPVGSGLVGPDGQPQVAMVQLGRIYKMWKRREIGPSVPIEKPASESVPDATGDSSPEIVGV